MVTAIGLGAAAIARAPACLSDGAGYVIAANAGAVVDMKREAGGRRVTAVVVYRPRVKKGWASQRILSRFDLETEIMNQRVVVPNSAKTCRRKR